MPIAYLTTKGMKVSLHSERHEVTVPRHAEGQYPARRSIPLVDIEHVVVDAGVALSTPALCGLLRKNIPVLFMAHGTFPSGHAIPAGASTAVLAAQLDRARDPAFRLEQSRRLIVAKIQNQKRVLQRLAANRSRSVEGTAAWLNSIANQARAAAGVDSLRGIEGAAAGRYFETLGAFFPPGLPFERRSRRPPHNPANALLSFVYTLLVAEFSMHLRAAGLEPAWGVYHETEEGRPSLSLDLLEPFHAPVADALVLDTLNHKRFQEEDFEYRDGGCFLRRDSRRKLFGALENRLEREFLHEQAGHRTTLRQVIKDHCYQAKRAFNEGCPLRPFKMN